MAKTDRSIPASQAKSISVALNEIQNSLRALVDLVETMDYESGPRDMFPNLAATVAKRCHSAIDECREALGEERLLLQLNYTTELRGAGGHHG